MRRARPFERLGAARIDAVDVDEGVRRAVSALVHIGNLLIVLVATTPAAPDGEAGAVVVEPLQQLLERGRSSGAIRGDVPTAWLADLLLRQVVTALLARPALGPDDATALVTSLFLDGAKADTAGERRARLHSGKNRRPPLPGDR